MYVTLTTPHLLFSPPALSANKSDSENDHDTKTHRRAVGIERWPTYPRPSSAGSSATRAATRGCSSSRLEPSSGSMCRDRCVKFRDCGILRLRYCIGYCLRAVVLCAVFGAWHEKLACSCRASDSGQSLFGPASLFLCFVLSLTLSLSFFYFLLLSLSSVGFFVGHVSHARKCVIIESRAVQEVEGGMEAVNDFVKTAPTFIAKVQVMFVLGLPHPTPIQPRSSCCALHV